MRKAQLLGCNDDLDLAISHAEDATILTEDLPLSPLVYRIYALCLSRRYQALGSSEDLDRAMRALEKVLERTDDGIIVSDEDRAAALYVRGYVWACQSSRTTDRVGLDNAIKDVSRSVKITGESHL